MANEASTGTHYAAEPILQDVTIGDMSTSGATMIEAVIQLRKNKGDSDALYEFSMGTTGSETVTFNIASAFRAELMKSGHKQLSPIAQDSTLYVGGDATNDSVTLYLATGTRCLINGDSKEDIPSSDATVTAWRGGRTDSERLYSSLSSTPGGTPVSVKPAGDSIGNDWETVNKDDTVMCGSNTEVYIYTVDADGNKEKQAISTSEVCAAWFDSRHIYIEDNPLRYQFMFENHLGFIESASCLMRESKTYKITSEDRYRTYAPSYTVQPSLFSRKSGGRASWKMSSGYVTRAWAEWFTTEFLMSPRHWLWIAPAGSTTQQWLPVSVTPDSDTTTIYDESKGELAAINFTVTSGIRGRI